MRANQTTGDAMSLVDEVHKLEQQLLSRLRELEPLTREYEQLRQLAERLGLQYSPEPEPADHGAQTPSRATRRRSAAKKRATPRTASKPGTAERGARAQMPARPAGADAPPDASPPASKSPARTRRSAGRKRTATRTGQRADDVMRVVTTNPGITVRQLGQQLGVDATGLYRVANKLTQDGRLRKDGTGLYAVESGAAASPDGTVEPAATPATDGAASADEVDAGDATSAGAGTSGSA
jgi:hypothetical protein